MEEFEGGVAGMLTGLLASLRSLGVLQRDGLLEEVEKVSVEID